jgi:hypothetical protein
MNLVMSHAGQHIQETPIEREQELPYRFGRAL